MAAGPEGSGPCPPRGSQRVSGVFRVPLRGRLPKLVTGFITRC